ncbi:MAG: glucose 1-dehydrogenase [Alphaproteobacteria bacterium]|nr:glucose 1-dehydrogenase [Alphaproteobacteria bacterium]
MTGRLAGRVCFVTGASSGIGRAISIRFAEEGACVILADRAPDPLEGGVRTESLIQDAGGTCLSVATDVSSWAAIDAAIGQTVAAFGRLDVMVNNAAISDGCRLLDTTEESWDRVMAVNLKGVYFGCKRAIQQMLGQDPLPEDEARGRIVNISSQHGMVCAPSDFSYGVSKAGVVYMTRQIAVDYAREGIVCNAVAPGKILTGRADGMENLDYSKSRTPLPRLGRPDDVASAAVYLASAEASYVTGHNLLVDGGWMAF